MELDKIITGDSAVVLQSFPSDCIDLTVTSPPYDNLRTYNGFVFDFETIAKQLYRVTKAGGVVVWVVGDATVNGSETGTSFRQALYFMQCGFNLHDTMIYVKTGNLPQNQNRYEPSFEYMFILSKGSPCIFNPIKEKTLYLNGGKVGHRKDNGEFGKHSGHGRNKYKTKTNVWIIKTGGGISSSDNFAHDHPAIFPEQLASDHIYSWSNEGDIVLDCFAGSGTTLKMAKMLNRHYIGIEISPEYVKLAERRLLATPVPLFGQGQGLTPRAADGYAASQQTSFIPDGELPSKARGATRCR
jgi:site-specific DNA-methyltransferase (adenine-specific)